MQQNGKSLPTIRLHWSAEKQAVETEFDPKEFKTYEFIIACLDMAKADMEFKRNMTRMANMQKAQQEAIVATQRAQVEAAVLSDKILRG